MRHIELQTDYQHGEDRGVRGYINLAYGFFSDHGNRPGKPLVWMFCLWGLVGVVLTAFDGGVQAQLDTVFDGLGGFT